MFANSHFALTGQIPEIERAIVALDEGHPGLG